MNARDAIKMELDMAQMVGTGYLDDLTDEQLMMRPHAGCNHINWQVGHLVVAEHQMIESILPGSMPALPDGMAEKYTKEAATSDDASQFATKSELLGAYQAQRAATLKALEGMTDEKLDTESPEEVKGYAPTYGALFSLQGSHWMMHCGQWVIVRRELGKPPLF